MYVYDYSLKASSEVQIISICHETETNRLLAAAIVSEEFREILLDNPLLALETGYNGTTFFLTAEQQCYISNIRAATLAEFAAQLKGT